MAKLQLLRDNIVIQTWDVAGPTHIIGRLQDADVRLEDPGVSRHHACMRHDVGTGIYAIEDLHSKNGTFVNGTKIASTQRLYDGDILYVGSSTLRFVDSDPLVDLLRSVEHTAGTANEP